MNKRLVVCSLAACLLAAGVSGQSEPAVSIQGSNTFGEELGPRLIEAYARHRPDVRIELSTPGSGGGLNALLNGECDIASSSRVASEDEQRRARVLGLKLRTHFIGSYGVAVVVNERLGVADLSPSQVRDLFTGRIRNWKELGRADVPVHLYIRDPASGTHLGFRELAMENRPYAEGALPLHTYAEIAAAVARDPGGVGYVGMSPHPLPGTHAVRIGGIPPNAVSVNEGLYPYARGLRFYTVRGREQREAGAFIRFVRESEGQGILSSMGFVPRLLPRIDPGSPVH